MSHIREAGIQSDEHVQALGLPDLPDHQTVRPHAQGLLDQAAQRNLALPLQVRLTALKTDDVAERQLQLKDFLHRYDPFAGADAGGEAIEHGGFARLGGARDQDVEAAGDGRTEEPGRLRGQRAQLHQVLEPAGFDHELADIDGPVTPGDVRDHDVQPGAVRERRIHERGGHVQAPARARQHPFHKVPDLLVRQRNGGQLRFAIARHIDFIRRVEPDFLDARVVQEWLECTEARHSVEDKSPGRLQRAQRGQRRQEGPFVVVADRRLDQAPDFAGLPQGVKAPPADQFTDLVLNNAYSLHADPHMTAAPVPGRWG